MVQSQARPCEICGAHSGTVTGFSPSTSFPLTGSFRQCSRLTTYMLLLPEYKRAKPENPPKSPILSEIGEHCIKTYLHFISVEGVTLKANCTYKSPRTRAWCRPTCRPGSQSTGSTPPVRCVSGSCQLPGVLLMSTPPLLPLYLQHHLTLLHTLQHKHSTGYRVN